MRLSAIPSLITICVMYQQIPYSSLVKCSPTGDVSSSYIIGEKYKTYQRKF